MRVCEALTGYSLWAAGQHKRLPNVARALLNDSENELLFSVASLFEIAIKRRLERHDFSVELGLLRRGLLDNGYNELAITSEHAMTFDILPPIHKDLFDRILIAQALSEGIMLLTSDPLVAKYPGSIRKV